MSLKTLESIVFAGTNGTIGAISTEEGPTPREIWHKKLEGAGLSVVNVLFDREALFATAAGHTWAVNPNNGSIIWRGPPPKGFALPQFTSLAVAENFVFSASQGRVSCLNRTDGALIWVADLGFGQFTPTLRPIAGAILAGINHNLVALGLADGRTLWTWNGSQPSLLNKAPRVSIVQDSWGTIQVATSGNLCMLDPKTGSPVGPTGLVAGHDTALASTTDVVFAVSCGTVFSVDPGARAQNWRTVIPGGYFSDKDGLSVVALPGGRAAVGTGGSVIIVTADGKVARAVSLPGCGFGNVTLALEGGTMTTIIAGSSGHVYGVTMEGMVAWHSDLPGQGREVVCIATSQGNFDPNGHLRLPQ